MSARNPLPPAEWALAIHNPYASNYARAALQVSELDVPLADISTEDGPITAERIDNAVQGFHNRNHSVGRLLGLGGDGHAHTIGNVLLSSDGQALGLNEIPFIPLRGGDANDIATMLNGKKPAAEVLRVGEPRTLHPLEVQVAHNGATQTRYALAYFSVGATAAAAEGLNELKKSRNPLMMHPATRVFAQGPATWNTMARYYPFRVRDPQLSGVEDQIFEVSELLFVRGNRMAKLGRFAARLNHDYFEYAQIKRRRHAGTLATMIKTALPGISVGEPATSRTLHIRNAPGQGSNVVVQYDGETDAIFSDSHVTVTISANSYKTISTRLT